MTTSMSSPLRALSEIISSGITNIETTYANHGSTFPSIEEPYKPSPFDDEELMEIVDRVIAAASQIIAMVKPAARNVIESALSFHLSSSLGIVNSANVPEILREAGSQGLHIKDIGHKCGVDSQKIGRVLRHLATNYIFKEVSPDVFANNRISSVMDTGKAVSVIQADPILKHDNTLGISALVGFCTDEMMKASVYLEETLLDPKKTSSQDPLDCAFSRAHGRESAFVFYERQENEFRFRRYGAAMHGTSATFRTNVLLSGFDWKSLGQDSLVVDVGGGVGSATHVLAKANPHLRFIVQDRPNVVANGVKFWETEYLEALQSGRVKLQEHDFFERQPVKEASIFLMRSILHDWPDDYAKKILIQLRPAAQSHCKLLVVDFLVPYATSKEEFKDIPGAQTPDVPYPLLSNLGMASNGVVSLDMLVMAAANAQERTVGQFIELCQDTGWKLESISRSRGVAASLLVFSPIQSHRVES